MRNINTVIFDLGRVVVRIDPEREKFARLMNAIGIEPREAFERFWYANEVRQHMTGEMSPRDFYQAVADRFVLKYTYEEFVEAWCDLFSPMPGMQELFEEVAKNYRVGILSDTDPLHWLRIREMLPWLDRAEKPTLSFEVGLLKPHPNMFATAAKDCLSEKHQCLFIDDLIANVDGSRYCGMPAVMFSDVGKLRRDLSGLRIL